MTFGKTAVLQNMKPTKFSALAATALVGIASIATAQTSVQTNEPAAPAQPVLDIPVAPTAVDLNNPNVRRATAKVNGAVITGTDVDHRVALTLAEAEGELAPEQLVQLRAQVLRNLIDETLQVQAAREQEMSVEASVVAESYLSVAQRFQRTAAEMDAELAKIGSSGASLRRQLEGQIAWDRLKRRNITNFVNVSEEEVNETIERMKADKGTIEYRLGEIYMASTPATREQVAINARQVAEQIRQGANFRALAVQYSDASTASQGGDLGFVRLTRLQSPELEAVVPQMLPGEVRGPIEVAGGFSIIAMLDQRQVLTADPRDAVLSLKQIAITLPQDGTQEQLQGMVDNFRNAVGRMRGCGNADAIAAEIGADVVTSDQVAARGLPADLQQTMLSLQVGQATPPFGTVEEGVRVLMLCGRDDPIDTQEPDFDTVMRNLEDERINKRAQRYLRDLRRDAIIEYS